MPPRVRCPSAPLAALDVSASSTLRQTKAAAPPSRAFSSTPACEKQSLNRRRMFTWLKSNAANKMRESDRGPRYMGFFVDQPFPVNPLFRSQPVLDDKAKNLIWEKVTQRGESLKEVSAEMGVDVRRVTAVIRLKEVEKQWERDGQKLATPYAKAVMAMLPKTSFVEGEKNQPHEPINEVHVHKWTGEQLFVPVPESRSFTREDAAKAFHDDLLSVDARAPQPGLIQLERDLLQGKGREESMAKFKQTAQKEEDRIARKLAKEREEEERQTTRFKSDRYEFRFKEINVEDGGPDGRSAKATGWRYGAPLQDRKRGKSKIPVSVP